MEGKGYVDNKKYPVSDCFLAHLVIGDNPAAVLRALSGGKTVTGRAPDVDQDEG